MRPRTLLLLAAGGFAATYAVVVLVALVVSGAALLRQPAAYYAALMPIVYCGVCVATATGHLPARYLRRIAAPLHLAVLPCLWLSFLGLGVVLPILMLLWLRVYRLRLSSEDPGT